MYVIREVTLLSTGESYARHSGSALVVALADVISIIINYFFRVFARSCITKRLSDEIRRKEKR